MCEQVDAPDEEKRDADEEEVVVVHDATAIPCDGEYCEGDDDAENFN
jgi:hypothetical protein